MLVTATCQDVNVFILQEGTQSLLLVKLKIIIKKTKQKLAFILKLFTIISVLAEETVFRDFTDKPVK